ncbi:MAG: sensor histidine kinase [Sporichthyaceae bacterium]
MVTSSGPDAATTVDAGLSARRRRSGLLLAVVVLAATTSVLVPLRDEVSPASVLLIYVLAVVAVAVVGGLLPALLTAVAAYSVVHVWLVEPYGELGIADVDNAISVAIFGLVAVVVSVTVEFAARSRAAAERTGAEAELLSRLAAAPVNVTSLADLLEEVAQTFGLSSVALLDESGGKRRVLGFVGTEPEGETARNSTLSVDAGDGLRLVGHGQPVLAADRRLLTRLAAAAARSAQVQRVAADAAQARELAEIDRLRSALLAAVGHDLRTPLAGIKAAASSLRQPDVDWSEADRDAFLADIEDSADRLGDLVANLLAMSRLQAGVLSVQRDQVGLDEVVVRAVLGTGEAVVVDVPDDLPLLDTDPGLLERVVANLVRNAERFAPAGTAVTVRGRLEPDGAAVTVAVVDSGPGVAPADWATMFAPFQRLDDRGGGVGLGLAIARGFTEALGGRLTPSQTPGGGLTMTVRLPLGAA